MGFFFWRNTSNTTPEKDQDDENVQCAKIEGVKEEVVKQEVKEEVVKQESVKPTIGEDDMQDLIDMLVVLRSVDKLRNNKEMRTAWLEKSMLTRKDFNKLLSTVPMFLGREDGTKSYQDISISCSPHVKKFLYNSKDTIDGYDISYSDYRDKIKAIKNSPAFQLAPADKNDGLVSKVTLNFPEDGREHVCIDAVSNMNNNMYTKTKCIIGVTCNDGKTYKYGFDECFADNKFLCYKPYQCTLADYLKLNTLSQKRTPLYQQKLLYPTRYVKALIQGLLTAVVERIRDGKPHSYLHPENILLHKPVFPPYPPSYHSLPFLNSCKDKIVNDAHEKKQYIVPVSFVHTNCTEEIEDKDALYELIFDLILEESEDNPLPQDWEWLKNALTGEAGADKLLYEKMSSDPVLWDWQKQLNLLVYANHLMIHSTPAMQKAVYGALKYLGILKQDWCKMVQNEKPWDLVFTYNGQVFERHKVDDMLRFFRNLATHIKKYSHTQAYLAHRISCLFPHLIREINSKLLGLGIKY